MAPTTKNPQAGQQSRMERLILLSAVFWKIPLILRVILLHVLKLSPASQYLDLKSELLVAVLRAFTNPKKPKSVGYVQRLTLKDPGVKGKIWISNVAAVVPPEQSIRDALISVIDAMAETGSKEERYRTPDIIPVEAEWTGYRADANAESKLPDVPEYERYRLMMKEVTQDTTVLYFHGGAYYLLDPASHRLTTKKLAKDIGGRVYSVRYRLAPQNPFPSAVLDALVSYFTLLYPPPEAFHDPISPSNIVFAGDSAGGHLSFTLLQVLLQMRRRNVKIHWFGVEREVPLPAGVACASPWLDVTQSLPSWDRNQQWDFLPPPNLLGKKSFPEDDVWPTKPPRQHLYIDDAYLAHPLAALHLCESWAGAPPVYMCCGWECLADEDKYLAAKLSHDGVSVIFEEYEALPHTFALLLPGLRQSQHCLRSWTGFITNACRFPDRISSSFSTILAGTAAKELVRTLDVKKLSPFTVADVRTLAYEKIGRKPPPQPPAPRL